MTHRSYLLHRRLHTVRPSSAGAEVRKAEQEEGVNNRREDEPGATLHGFWDRAFLGVRISEATRRH